MKYEVVGWVSESEADYPDHGSKTASVDFAIIRDIRKNNYCFSGNDHEDNIPLLNDGTLAIYSWRGWGRIMAMAYGNESDYGYMDYYMDMTIDPKEINIPYEYPPKDYLIVPKQKIVEVFEMHLLDDEFEAIKNGQKSIDIRLFDKKRKQIDFGDYIRFLKTSDESQSILMRVKNIDLEETFENMYEYMKSKGHKENLGFKDLDSFKNRMYQFYTEDDEEEFGVIALYLEKPVHSCVTYFGIWFSPSMRASMYRKIHKNEEGIESLDDDTINEILENDLKRETNAVKPIIRKTFEGLTKYICWYRMGLNEEYDEDVNVMLRKTLKNLFGKEEIIKNLQYEYCVPMTLNIFALNIEKCDEKKQNLELDKDILEFLEKSNVQLQFEKRDI